MFAIVETGGKQYKVSVGDIVDVEKIEGLVETQVTLNSIVALGRGNGGIEFSPSNISVVCEIISQFRGEKLIIFKKRRRHTYKRKKGHRQSLTKIKIISINI